VNFYQEKIFHRLESDSARNNIHPNNKQKPEITNKNTGERTCQQSRGHGVALVGLAPPNKAPSPSKLKNETV